MKSFVPKNTKSMCFLVRDWSYPYEHAFGEDGGSEYLMKVLKTSSDQHDEIKVVRKHIHSCFDTLSCFLMPHPGLKVATSPTFDGRLADIDNEFKTFLEQLAPLLLDPSQLIIKRINGNIVTGRGLVECFKAYMKIFESDELPEPKSMLRATAEANNLAALATAFDRYNREMEELCGAETPYLAPDKLEEHHKMLRSICVDQFINTPKMGGEEFSTSFLEKLECQIDESYESFVKRNESKHILNAYKTPAVLGCIMVFSYILSYILEIIGIQSLTQMAVLGLYLPLLFLVMWLYVRYSGHLREAGQFIDNFTGALWQQFLQPVYVTLMQKGMQHAVKMGTSAIAGDKKTK